jgi:transcriptional regulator with GAF, ATPase, and Fis domain
MPRPRTRKYPARYNAAFAHIAVDVAPASCLYAPAAGTPAWTAAAKRFKPQSGETQQTVTNGDQRSATPAPDIPGEYTLDPSRQPGQAISGKASPGEERLRLVYELGLEVCGEADLDRVLQRFVSAVPRLVGGERWFVATFDAGRRLTPLATHDLDLPPRFEDWPVSKTAIGRVLRDGVSLLTSDAQECRELAGARSVELHNIRSLMCVPLGARTDPAGVIYVDSRLRAGIFSPDDLRFLTALGHSLYVAIRNANRLAKLAQDRELDEARRIALQRELFADHRIVGRSPGLLDAYEQLKRVAPKTIPILLYGESGTGKELFAHAAHMLSPRADRPFVAVNIAALNESLVESELFGHEKGAFTGAVGRRIGRFELAHTGTLLLDEVGDIPLPIQTKLLRALETGEIERAGSEQPIRTDVRLVCATHRDLEQLVRAGQFREDLFYRLMGVRIRLPPLRERPDDIADLVDFFLRQIGSTKRFSEEALLSLRRFEWPGNARQLGNVVRAIDAVCVDSEVTTDVLPPFLVGAGAAAAAPAEFAPMRQVLADAERAHLQKALESSGGNKERARELLGLCKDTFYKRLRAYGLN